MKDSNVSIENPVYCLAVSPAYHQDGKCFAARASGLIHTEDGGRTWQSAYASLNLSENLMTTAVCLSPNFLEEPHVFAGFAGGILRSVDGGKNWRKSIIPEPSPVISVLASSPNYSQDRTLFAGTMEDGMLLSVDGGGTWHPWNFGLLDARVTCLAISPNLAEDETLYAGTESGIFVSKNNGRSWTETGFNPELAPVLSLAFSSMFPDQGVIFAGTLSNGLFLSADNGQTWQRLGADEIPEAVNTVLVLPGNDLNFSVLVLTEDRLLLSHDSGAKWSEVPADFGGDISLSVAAPEGLGQNARLLVGTQSGKIINVSGISLID